MTNYLLNLWATTISKIVISSYLKDQARTRAFQIVSSRAGSILDVETEKKEILILIRKNKKIYFKFIILSYGEQLLNVVIRIWKEKNDNGLSRDLNPGPRAPEARIIPLDHWADVVYKNILFYYKSKKYLIVRFNFMLFQHYQYLKKSNYLAP